MIIVRNTTRQAVNLTQLQKLGQAWLEEQGLENQEVSLVLVGARRMRRLNREFRGIDRATDVLSFPASAQVPQNQLLGEIVINLVAVAKPNNYLTVFGKRRSATDILEFLLIHGLLHLIGYQDDTEAGRQAMLKRGAEFLARFYNQSVNDIIKDSD